MVKKIGLPSPLQSLEKEVGFNENPILSKWNNKKDLSRGLVPIGDTGLYITPDTPASPTDCSRWPDSPFCSVLPLSLKFVEILPSLSFDNCNVAINFTPTLAFIKLPIFRIAYRYPQCRDLPPPPPFVPPPGDNYSLPLSIPPLCRLGSSGLALIITKYVHAYGHASYSVSPNGEIGEVDETYTTSLGDFQYPYTGSPVLHRGVLDTPIASFTATQTRAISYDQYYADFFTQNHSGNPPPLPAGFTRTQTFYFWGEQENQSYQFNFSSNVAASTILILTDSSRRSLAQLRNHKETQRNSDGSIDSIFERQYEVFIKCVEPRRPPTIFPPPPPPVRKPPPMPPVTAGCTCAQISAIVKGLKQTVTVPVISCQLKNGIWTPVNTPTAMSFFTLDASTVASQAGIYIQLANQAISLCEAKNATAKLSQAVGVEELPGKLPTRLIYPNGKGDTEVNSLIQAFGYLVKQVDKAVGYLPQKIKVADVNSAKAGNQSVELDIHSFADFARETLQYLIDTEGDDDTLTNIAVRIIYECGAIHQLSVQNAAMLDCIVEYLDFKEKWKAVKVPFAFDPYAGQKGKKAGQGFGKGADTKDKPIPLTEEELEKMLPALLTETEVEIKVLHNDQSRSLNDILQDMLRDIRLAAAALSDSAKGEKLEQLVSAAQAVLQLQNAIDRNNVRKGLTAGDLRTRKKAK